MGQRSKRTLCTAAPGREAPSLRSSASRLPDTLLQVTVSRRVSASAPAQLHCLLNCFFSQTHVASFPLNSVWTHLFCSVMLSPHRGRRMVCLHMDTNGPGSHSSSPHTAPLSLTLHNAARSSAATCAAQQDSVPCGQKPGIFCTHPVPSSCFAWSTPLLNSYKRVPLSCLSSV